MESESVSRWIRQLAQGDQAAAYRLWNRYGRALERLARNRFGLALNAAFDEEDLAQSVFISLWQNAESGRLNNVTNRTELWFLLFEISRRRALSHLEHSRAKKRGGGRRPLSIHSSDDSQRSLLDELNDPQLLPPDVLLILNEEQERAISMLEEDQLPTVAQLHLEGFSDAEIATQIHVSTRTVQRKVRRIWEIWEREFGL